MLGRRDLFRAATKDKSEDSLVEDKSEDKSEDSLAEEKSEDSLAEEKSEDESEDSWVWVPHRPSSDLLDDEAAVARVVHEGAARPAGERLLRVP